jgi:hypothetical protein
MSIYTINSALSTTKKIETLNSMLLELSGKTDNSQFNKNEIDQLYQDSGINRKYIRDRTLGHTLSTYTNWSHVQTEVGYSIWKIAPSTYSYNSNNALYCDDKLFTNVGQANSETASTFDYVYLYNGDSGTGYTDNTTEAGTDSGTEFSLMDSINDYLYLGLSTTFSGIKFEFNTRGSNYTLKVEYYDSTAVAWVELTASSNDLDDNTNSFESDGNIIWSSPSTWGATTVNGQSKYWIRISTSTTPTTIAEAYYIIPANSVIGLLAMSSSEILAEEWKWCSYGTYIYVTIRNSGQAAYEGDYYITSSSSTANKQNYFIYNHEFKSDYEDSTYVSISVAGYFLVPVEDKDLSTPPTSGLSNGNRYLIITGDSGTDWSGYDKYIATYNTSSDSWSFTNPVEGMLVYVKDENRHYFYNGSSWEIHSSSGGSIDWQESIKDKDLSTPPISPSEGDRYIVASVASGDWLTHENDITEYIDSAWVFTTPSEGFTCEIEDENKIYTFNGTSWVTMSSIIDHSVLQNLSADDHPQYLHLNKASQTILQNILVDAGVTIDGRDISADLNQAVKTTDSPTFANLTIVGSITGINVTSGTNPGHLHTLDNLSDVEVYSGLATNQVLRWDGSVWRNNTLNDLYLKIDQTTPQTVINGIPVFNLGISSGKLTNLTTNGFVITSGGNGTLSIDTSSYSLTSHTHTYTLDSLSDVTVLSGLINNQVLTWDADGLTWRNATLSHAVLGNLDYATSGHTGFQATLVSATNIKSINSASILASGDLSLQTPLVNSAGLSTAIGGDVAVVDGGTGKSSWTQYLLVYADTTTSFSQIAIGDSGQVLMSNGAGAAPSFQTFTPGASTLDALSDVFASSGLGDKDILAYDANLSLWRNQTISELGIGDIRGTFTNASLTAGVLTITHNLGLSAPYTIKVIIFDNNGDQVWADDVTGSTNSVAVDISSQGTITGTWGYLY